MPFIQDTLGQPRPERVREVTLPRRERYFPSPLSWIDEVLYFLLPDRFSDANEAQRPLLDPHNRNAARAPVPPGAFWRWDNWATSGASRWQGGTINGIRSKLDYLQQLGVTTLWVGPIFKQRGHLDTYHGYGVQDFLDVDPRLGTRADLVALVQEAHQRGLRVLLDIIFNHSGSNWLYPPGTSGGIHEAHYTSGRYPFGDWRGTDGDPVGLTVTNSEEGVWPHELQNTEDYTRAGSGSLGAGDFKNDNAEHKRSDFNDLRDFSLDAKDASGVTALNDLVGCYKYWIALTDCDGFRIDTLKHVTIEQARNFCGAIKEFATNLGKKNFFLVGEIAGGDDAQDWFLDTLQRNLNAALDIGGMRPTLTAVAKGLAHPDAYFEGFRPDDERMGSHRFEGEHHVSILDDHDHVFGDKVRFSADAALNSLDHQVVVGVAIQLFSLGIPCIYYGTEQAFAGPEAEARPFLESYRGSDRYLREAMFGPEHPRRRGRAGIGSTPAAFDPDLPGFGPFGTAGQHCFNSNSPAYVRIAALGATRQRFRVLRHGRQYRRPIAYLTTPFDGSKAGEIIAWSRILDDEEALCIVNSHGNESRGADVLVDFKLSAPGTTLTVVANTAQSAALSSGGAYTGSHPVGSTVTVQRKPNDGPAFVEIRDVKPAEVLILINHP